MFWYLTRTNNNLEQATNTPPQTNQQDNNNEPVVNNDGKNNNEAGEDIDTSDWLTYRNEEYGYEMKYPKNWSFYVINIDDSFVKGRKIKNVIFLNSDKKYSLLFGLINKQEYKDNEVRIDGGRTGFPAVDDFKQNEYITIVNNKVAIIYLIYRNKVKEVYFSKSNPQYEPYEYFNINEKLVAHATFSLRESLDYEKYNIAGVKELTVAKEILKSLKIIN